MSKTLFLNNDKLWSEIRTRVKGARKVKAAVAFLGNDGSNLLPLKKGDTLVVNMGIQQVRQGITAPREIQRLIRRGVRVFSRSTLHAKFFICDGALLVGSTNISRNSQNTLDESALLTRDVSAIRRATDFFYSLCTEPVRPEYLKRCLKEYRPPAFSTVSSSQTGQRHQRVVEAKLWFRGGLRYREVPANEKKQIQHIESRAWKRLRESKGTTVDYTHYVTKPKYFSHVRIGDWVVNCIADGDGNRFIHPPQQVLGQENYARGRGKRRYFLLSEAPENGQRMTLAAFRQKIRHIEPRLDSSRPRTMPVENFEVADSILSLWSMTGKILKRTRRKNAARNR